MGIADYIALGIIAFLLICAVKYMISSRKKGGCNGCCSGCMHSCPKKLSEDENK